MVVHASPELLRWVDEQLARGCDPAEMIEAMTTVGHARSFAQSVIARASGKKNFDGIAIGASENAHENTHASDEPIEVPEPLLAPLASGKKNFDGIAIGASENTHASDEPIEVPEPLLAPLASGASAIVLDDHRVDVLINLHHPRIIVFGGLLKNDECDALIAASRPQLARSETVNRASGGTEFNQARTSEGTYFFHDASPLLQTINRRIAQVTRWPLAHGEPLQILHYNVGAEYQPHYDYFSPEDAGTPSLLTHGGQRVGTLIIYLNTPDAGGATVFPDVGLEVAAIRGNAVFFAYDRPSPASRTLHGGTPVVAGEKWIATRWMREGMYT